MWITSCKLRVLNISWISLWNVWITCNAHFFNLLWFQSWESGKGRISLKRIIKSSSLVQFAKPSESHNIWKSVAESRLFHKLFPATLFCCHSVVAGWRYFSLSAFNGGSVMALQSVIFGKVSSSSAAAASTPQLNVMWHVKEGKQVPH